jgi:hypothetical protein
MLTSKLSERVQQLEEKLSSFQSLASLTRMLKTASPAEVKEWMAVCEEVMEKNGASVVKKTSGKTKTKTKSKRTSNSEGPTEWNVFKTKTWHEMAAQGGVIYEDFMKNVDQDDEKAVEKAKKLFGKAAAGVGAGYQAAMKEASRRKDEMEGRNHEEEVAKKAAKKSPKSKAVAAAAAKAESEDESEAEESEAEEEEQEQSDLAKKMAEMNMVLKDVDGTTYIVDKDGGEAYLLEDGTFGDRCGAYNAKTGIIDFDA